MHQDTIARSGRRCVRSLLVLAVTGALVVLAGCSSLFGSDNKEAAYVARPVQVIYADAWRKIRDGSWLSAAKQFGEVERQHPYSVWARRAMLMSAYCYYQANHAEDAINAAEQYIELHPGSKEVAYAFYLKAIALYDRITDVGRDQTDTQRALAALEDVIQRFPNTAYARDASLKVDLALDHLAGKDMDIGRYYLFQQDYVAAINRFRVVVERYQRTAQVAEALERLTEAYYALGLDRQAQTAAAVLGANYPGSRWYRDAYNLLKKHHEKAVIDKKSWIAKAFAKVF